MERFRRMSGQGWLTGGLIEWRRRRWERADHAFHEVEQQRDEDFAISESWRAALAAARNRIGRCRPARPAWIVDRLRAAGSATGVGDKLAERRQPLASRQPSGHVTPLVGRAIDERLRKGA